MRHINRWEVCDCCRMPVPKELLEQEHYKEYKSDTDTKVRTACVLCRAVFPPEEKSNTHSGYYEWTAILAIEARERHYQDRQDRVRNAIRRMWCEIQGEMF